MENTKDDRRSALIRGHEVDNLMLFTHQTNYPNLFLQDLGSLFDEEGDYNQTKYIPPVLFWIENNLRLDWKYIIFVPRDHLGITSIKDPNRDRDYRKYLCIGIKDKGDAMYFKLSFNNVTHIDAKRLQELNLGLEN